VGTALLVFVGLSIVIADFGAGSPVARAIPSPLWRRVLTGFLFGATGAAIAVSWVGKVSGAHINPVVSLAFRARGKLSTRDTVGYVAAQFAGAVAGALPLLVWGRLGRSVQYGATVPGAGYPIWMALAGEVVTTCALIVGLFVFIGHKTLRRYTPLLFPVLYAVMVGLEAPLSGTSTNPARTFGPAVVAGVWSGWWIYLAGPLAGMLIGVGLFETRWFDRFEFEVAKVYHFEERRVSDSVSR
jgi:aquaporin Z